MVHLKIFSVLGYSHMDEHSKPYYLIGYNNDEIGYHLWDNVEKKLALEWNVIFNENFMCKDRQFKVQKPKDIVEEDDIVEDVMVPNP